MTLPQIKEMADDWIVFLQSQPPNNQGIPALNAWLHFAREAVRKEEKTMFVWHRDDEPVPTRRFLEMVEARFVCNGNVIGAST